MSEENQFNTDSAPEEVDSFAEGRKAAMDQKGQNPFSTYDRPEDTPVSQPVYSAPEMGVTGIAGTDSEGNYRNPYEEQPYGAPSQGMQGQGGTSGDSSYNYGQQGSSDYNNNGYNNSGYSNYGQPNGYNPYGSSKKEGITLGVVSLVLGILSIFCCCTGFNVILSIFAIILGIIQIVNYREKGLAIGGIVTGVIAIILTIIMFVAFIPAYREVMESPEYREYMESILGDDADEVFDQYDMRFGNDEGGM